MKKQFKLLGLLLVAGLTFAACSSDDIVTDQNTSGKWTATATVGKALGTHTRTLTEGGADGALTVGWKETDEVLVYNEYGEYVGFLTPESTEGSSVPMSGDLEGNSYTVGQSLSLYYPSKEVDYTGQDGTLETIAEKYDFAEGTTTVAEVDGTSLTLNDVVLTSKQAIVQFRLRLNGHAIVVTSLKVSSPALAEPIELKNPEGFDDVVYVALPMSSTPQAAEYTIECDYDFGPLKAVRKNITMENGKFYTATIELQNMLPYIPLTLVALEEGNLIIMNPLRLTISYRRNGGELESVSAYDNRIEVLEGDVIELFGNNDAYAVLLEDGTTLNATQIHPDFDCEMYGNVNSLLDKDNFGDITEIPKEYAFASLFQDGVHIYNGKYPIALPATTLKEGCYDGMFRNCKIHAAPDLPAPMLVKNCYAYMFYECSRLTWVSCLATDISAQDCTTNWLDGVAESGFLEKAESMEGWPTDSPSGLPSGWSFYE